MVAEEGKYRCEHRQVEEHFVAEVVLREVVAYVSRPEILVTNLRRQDNDWSREALHKIDGGAAIAVKEPMIFVEETGELTSFARATEAEQRKYLVEPLVEKIWVEIDGRVTVDFKGNEPDGS